LEIERVAYVITSEEWLEDIQVLTALFGAPSMIDGEAWAQFDIGGARVCLAGADERVESVAMMCKVADFAATSNILTAHGYRVGPVERWAHEERVVAARKDRQIVLYRPL